jgi:hypothetical protein
MCLGVWIVEYLETKKVFLADIETPVFLEPGRKEGSISLRKQA